jgi:trehalose 6-phosphate phosphatase
MRYAIRMDSMPPPSPDCCLFLDVDGTLIELAATPFESVADPEIKALLVEVGTRLGGALALVSGRTISYLDALLAPLRLPTAGLHGVERRDAAGVLHGSELADPALDGARAAFKALVNAHPGTVFEDKGRSIAIHYRLAPQYEPRITEVVSGIAARAGPHYHLQHGIMMLELKPAGSSKATAIAAFLEEPPFHGRRPVFVGDDLTDHDGFEIVEARGGISVAVGDRVRAQYRAANVSMVRAWLKDLAALPPSAQAAPPR